MRIALVAPPLYCLPPRAYAGTERVVATLGAELHRRGHEVTVFAPGDSDVPYRLIPTVERGLWASGYRGDIRPFLQATVDLAARHLREFDLVHSHLEGQSLPMAATSPIPVITTLHGRLDMPETAALLACNPDAPLIAISHNQRRWFPANNWLGVVHHGLEFGPAPVERPAERRLVVVGRATREKGLEEAIDVARRCGWPLVVAAKAFTAAERAYVKTVIEPAVADGVAEFLGEIDARERDRLVAGASATLMLGGWPEPFGLVAIESMAVGTPVIGRRAGALPELIEHGVDGFLVDDTLEACFALDRLGGLDRDVIRERARRRFDVTRMVDEYEAIYRSVLDGGSAGRGPSRSVVAGLAEPGQEAKHR